MSANYCPSRLRRYLSTFQTFLPLRVRETYSLRGLFRGSLNAQSRTDSESGACQKPHWFASRKQWSRVNTSGLGSSSVLFPRAGHGSTEIYPRDYKDYAEIESLPSHPARMPKCVSGKLSLNHCVFTRGRYRASDPKLYASRIAYHQRASPHARPRVIIHAL